MRHLTAKPLLFLLSLNGIGLITASSACTSSDNTSTTTATNDAGGVDGRTTLPSGSTCTSPNAVPRKENGECAALGEYGMDPAQTFCCIPCKADEVVVNAGAPKCVPKNESDASTKSDADASAGVCSLAFYPPDYPVECQPALDQICCNEEKACAGDVACAQAVDCIAKCPAPRQDACINNCVPPSAKLPKLEAIGTCSKSPAFDPDGGTRCSYP